MPKFEEKTRYCIEENFQRIMDWTGNPGGQRKKKNDIFNMDNFISGKHNSTDSPTVISRKFFVFQKNSR